MLQIGSAILGQRPAVALALGDSVPREDIANAVAKGVDLLEMRIDTFGGHDSAHVVAVLETLTEVPLLGTIRSPREGGAWKGDEAARRTLYEAILPHVDAVDIEIGAEIAGAVIETARTQGKTVIGSFHDFAATPSAGDLEAAFRRGTALNVDIVKVAAHCASPRDLRRLASFTIDHAEDGIIVIGMGPLAMNTRILFPALGSLVTYTFLGAATAPGQLNCADTLRYRDAFFGDWPAPTADGPSE